MLLLLTPIIAANGLLGLLLYLVLFIIVAGTLFWAVNKLSAAFAIPEPVRSMIIVIAVLIMVFALLYIFLGGTGARI